MSPIYRNHCRPIAALLSAVMLLGVAGCGGPTIQAQSPSRSQPPVQPAPQRQGLSTKQKVMLVAGAAAVYYLYKKHQNAKGEGKNGRYYRSKNGRVYYRDLKTGAYRWVDPPQQPISVPADEYERVTGQRVNTNGGVLRQAPAGW